MVLSKNAVDVPQKAVNGSQRRANMMEGGVVIYFLCSLMVFWPPILQSTANRFADLALAAATIAQSSVWTPLKQLKVIGIIAIQLLHAIREEESNLHIYTS